MSASGPSWKIGCLASTSLLDCFFLSLSLSCWRYPRFFLSAPRFAGRLLREDGASSDSDVVRGSAVQATAQQAGKRGRESHGRLGARAALLGAAAGGLPSRDKSPKARVRSIAVSEDRTHDLRIMRHTHCQLRNHRFPPHPQNHLPGMRRWGECGTRRLKEARPPAMEPTPT